MTLRSEGADTVLQVRFTTPVQYQRSVSMPSGDFVQAFYELLPPREGASLESGQRRVVGGDRLPRVTVTDESVGAAGASRKLVVRFAEPQRARVRAGASNRSIEFVLVAMGRRPVAAPVAAPASSPTTVALPPSPPAAASAPLPERYVVLVQSTADGQPAEAPVPRALQDYTVFVETRVVGGRALSELKLGYFDNRAAAERARELLASRFPKARVIDLNQPRAAETEADPEAEPVTASPVAPSSPQDELDRRAAALLASAREAKARGDVAAALLPLGRLLDMPLNASTREAQAIAALLRAKSGDVARARTEMALFLERYPSGADADRVRAALAALSTPAPRARLRAPIEPSTTLAGSLSQFYYGGQSKVRTQEFQDSPISGLPELVSEGTVSGTDQKQSVTSVDVNWRHRDAERDMRFVLRDNYNADLLDGERSRNRLSALYFDHRSTALGTQVRVGRQSGTGAGVLGRFDGVQGACVSPPAGA